MAQSENERRRTRGWVFFAALIIIAICLIIALTTSSTTTTTTYGDPDIKAFTGTTEPPSVPSTGTTAPPSVPSTGTTAPPSVPSTSTTTINSSMSTSLSVSNAPSVPTISSVPDFTGLPWIDLSDISYNSKTFKSPAIRELALKRATKTLELIGKADQVPWLSTLPNDIILLSLSRHSEATKASAAYLVLYSSKDYLNILDRYNTTTDKFAAGDRDIANTLFTMFRSTLGMASVDLTALTDLIIYRKLLYAVAVVM